MKTILIAASVVIAGITAQAQTNWKLDPAHSSVKFSVSHMVISEVEGDFKKFETNVTSKSANDFTDATVNFTIDVASVNTDNEMRDKHLKSDDFFNAEKFPQIVFKSKSMTKTGKDTYSLKGDLTIRDITKPFEFQVVYGGTIKDPYGNTKSGFKINGTLNRFDYNLKFDMKLESGSRVVGDVITLRGNMEFAQEKAK